jgi:hypothetical protein
MSGHSAFPADGFTARWQTWDRAHDEVLTLRWENEGWTATGEVGREKAHYVIRLSATWQVRQFLLFRDLDQPDLWLATDGSGRWGEMNGAHRTDLDGCVDLGLWCTPFSHTMPIRRIAVDVGDQLDLRIAMIDVETLGVVPVAQRFHRIAPRRWRHTSSRAEASTPVEFEVDEYGLVLDYAGQFRRR